MNSFSSLLQEHRLFQPPKQFSDNAEISSMDQYSSLLKEAQFDILEHWNKQAKRIHWFSSWKTILDWKHPKAQWFKEGTINASFNCLDIHLGTEYENKKSHYMGKRRRT